VVAFTGGQGVILRWTPGGPRAGAIPENTLVKILYRRAVVNETEWVEVMDAEGRTGWVAAEYLEVIP
jgi:hypothetical protein